MFVLDDLLGQRVRVTLGTYAGLKGTVIGQESDALFRIELDEHAQGIYLVCQRSILERIG
jgi:hypothetical protein